VSETIAQNLTSSRDNVIEEALMKWFKEIYQYLLDKNFQSVLDGLCYVFTAEETAFFLNPKSFVCLVAKGDRNVYQQVHSDEKECLTVLVTGKADVILAHPVVVFHCNSVPQDS
jgi:chemotaxis methyl-accepting protein methylase